VAAESQSTVTTYEVVGENLPGGRARVVARTSEIRFDGTELTGDELPGPADLLAAALAACILKNVERFAHILHFAYHKATVHVVMDRVEPPPRIVRARYALHVQTDQPQAKLELLHRNIRKFGTITNTLAAAADLQGEIIAVPPSDPTTTDTARGHWAE
jgi:uncharacterized OsmC-like protein